MYNTVVANFFRAKQQSYFSKRIARWENISRLFFAAIKLKLDFKTLATQFFKIESTKFVQFSKTHFLFLKAKTKDFQLKSKANILSFES